MQKIFVILITIVFLFPVFSGCKKEPPRKKAPKTRVARAEKPEIKSETETQKIRDVVKEKYAYNPAGKRDPFVPLVKAMVRKTKKKEVVPGTLESYDITDFKLIAVATRGKERYALLLAPDNKSYSVKVGTVVGLNEGKVKEIKSDNVVLVEYIEDYKGELKPKKVVLELRKGEVQ